MRADQRMRLLQACAATVAVAFSATGMGAPVVAGAAHPTSGPEEEGAAAALAAGKWSALPTAPLAARDGESFLWTGQELLVWGGSTGVDPDSDPRSFGDGAGYDPTTGHWARMAPSPLSPREGAAAVWAGNAAFFWGGDQPTTDEPRYVASGALYYPSTNTWRRLPAAPIGARSGAVASWTGASVVVFGGSDHNGAGTVPLGGASFDLATGKWEKLPPWPRTLPGEPISTSAVWTGHELLAFVTDMRTVRASCPKPCVSATTTSVRAEVAAWAPGQRSWQVLPGAPNNTPDASFTAYAQALWTGHEALLIGGGGCLPGEFCPLQVQPDGGSLAYDPANGYWHQLGVGVGGNKTWPVVWTGSALTVIDMSRYRSNPPPFTAPGAGAAFDLASGTWLALPHAPVAQLQTPVSVWTGRQELTWGATSAGQTQGAALTSAPGDITSSGASGHLDGVARFCPPPGFSKAPAGLVLTISAAGAGHPTAYQFVTAPFWFHFALAPGHYVVRAKGDFGPAAQAQAEVHEGSTAQVDTTCSSSGDAP